MVRAERVVSAAALGTAGATPAPLFAVPMGGSMVVAPRMGCAGCISAPGMGPATEALLEWEEGRWEEDEVPGAEG